jgi:hypothetical protein
MWEVISFHGRTSFRGMYMEKQRNMKKIINFKQAVLITLLVLGYLILFHLSVIIGIIFFNFAPIDFLWGGQMKTVEELLRFEIVSFLTSIFYVFLVMLKSKKINIPKLIGVANVAMWVLFAMFSLNTIANLLAKTTFEKSFAILSGLLVFLLLRIAIEKKTNQA